MPHIYSCEPIVLKLALGGDKNATFQKVWKEIAKKLKQSGLSQRKMYTIHDVNRNRLQY